MNAWTALTGDQLSGNDTATVVTNTNKKVYIVPYTHLDLQWGWTLQTSLDSYIPNTMTENFKLLSKYPDYRFSFEGAYRYMLMKQYYPANYATLKDYVAQGRWYPAGAMIEAVDVNMPSPETLIRQILYGNRFFQQEFGKTSTDILLPDCFGFPYTLPTIAAHCGLKGFSTQKFDLWGGFRPSPFSIGQWEGVDGSRIVAVLKPGAYSSTWNIRENDLNELGQLSGVYDAYDYFGQGDEGGAPDESEVASLMTRIQQNSTSEIEVRCTSSDQIFRDLTDNQISMLPSYKGELLMTTHGTGCYTAHADQKLLNRSDESMAAAAERSSVLAELFAGTEYPLDQINQNWILFMIHDFHDDLTGTSIQPAYDNFSTPARKSALSALTQIRDDANTAIAALLDTRVDDQTTTIPVVVYNPVAIERHDIADVTVAFPGSAPIAVRVYDKGGIEVPSQIKEISGQNVRVLFMADVLAVGYAVFQVKNAIGPCALSTGLQVNTSMLENERYRVTIDANGDASSIFDKSANKELLASPSRFEMRDDQSSNWPAWEVLYDDVISSPRSYVDEAVQKVVIDSGAARVTLRVTRSSEGSNYTHDYSLTADTTGYLQVDNVVDWQANNPNGSLLKVSFPLTVSNLYTTYDLGLGTIERGVNTPDLYEVPAQQWADITNPDMSYGVAVLNNCKYGWDKPAKNIIQLTLIHTPNGRNWYYEGDRYVHNFTYAVYGHLGSWADGIVVSAAERLNQPLVPFQTTPHGGASGKSVSLIQVDPSQIAVMAVKKSESEDEYIIRVREAAGKSWQNVAVNVGAEIISAREVNGMEEDKGGVNYSTNAISFDIGAYQPKTFALRLRNTSDTSGGTTPEKFALLPPYPNPANHSVNISFDLPQDETVTIRIFNPMGQLVRTLVHDKDVRRGRRKFEWDVSNDHNQSVSSSVYFIQVRTSKNVATQKVVVVK